VAKSAMEQFASARKHPADLINGAIETFVREHFELRALSTLRRLVGTVQQRIHDQRPGSGLSSACSAVRLRPDPSRVVKRSPGTCGRPLSKKVNVSLRFRDGYGTIQIQTYKEGATCRP